MGDWLLFDDCMDNALRIVLTSSVLSNKKLLLTIGLDLLFCAFISIA